jgi:hypothetical protein
MSNQVYFPGHVFLFTRCGLPFHALFHFLTVKGQRYNSSCIKMTVNIHAVHIPISKVVT